MNVSRMAVIPPSSNTRQSGSFAESLRKEESAAPQLAFASAKSFRMGDLATNFSFVSPDFIPAMGDGMLDATAVAEGATDEMRRYEEEMNHR